MPPRADSNSRTQAELKKHLATATGLEQKQIGALIDELEAAIRFDLRKHGEIKLFGLFNVKVKHVPARPARPGRNPFTGKEMMFKAKPAHKTVKVSALKKLKDLI